MHYVNYCYNGITDPLCSFLLQIEESLKAKNVDDIFFLGWFLFVKRVKKQQES